MTRRLPSGTASSPEARLLLRLQRLDVRVVHAARDDEVVLGDAASAGRRQPHRHAAARYIHGVWGVGLGALDLHTSGWGGGRVAVRGKAGAWGRPAKPDLPHAQVGRTLDIAGHTIQGRWTCTILPPSVHARRRHSETTQPVHVHSLSIGANQPHP
eukprot:360141-Chlamydomonas_euryale.AAC.1